MKKVVMVALIILCTSCASNKDMKSTSSQAGKFGQQHGIALSLAAFYYCEYKKWPENLSDLEKYQRGKNIKFGVPTSWEWLLSKDVTYSSNPSYSLYSSSHIGNPKPVVMSSGQNPPICNNGENELVDAYINMDMGN